MGVSVGLREGRKGGGAKEQPDVQLFVDAFEL